MHPNMYFMIVPTDSYKKINFANMKGIKITLIVMSLTKYFFQWFRLIWLFGVLQSHIEHKG